MSAFRHIPVDANLIHKDHQDDVLISNLRSELPTRLSVEDLKSPLFSDAERAFLARHFTEVTEEDGLCSGASAFMVRRSVPIVLPLEAAEISELEFITQHYKANSKHFVLQSKYIPEEQEAELASRYLPVALQLEPADRADLAALTVRLPCQERTGRYYFNMFNDLRNYFFYRKHHEHVPGLMLIEVARQAGYAQYYHTSVHKRGEITLTLSDLECRFEDYVESNYPVTISAETLELKQQGGNSGQVRSQVCFFQKGRRVAVIEMLALPIKMKLFKRLRVGRVNPEHWFVPVKGFAPAALFFCPDGKRIEGKLQRVACNAIEVRLDQQTLPADTILNFVVAIDGIGYVDGQVRLSEMREVGDAVVGRFQVEKMTGESTRRWLEAIKNFSHVEPGLGVV